MNKYYDIKIKKDRLSILKKYKNFSFSQNLLENEKKLHQVVTKFKHSIIIHLAAQAGVRYILKNPTEYLKSNIYGTFNVLKISKKKKIKHLIIGSSSSVYGANKNTPFKENHKTDLQVSFYAATKKSTENIAHSYSSLWGIPVTILRFFTVYGPWESQIWHILNSQKKYWMDKKLIFLTKVRCTEITLILMTSLLV